MKKLIIAIMLLATYLAVNAQSKVKEKDIIGEWELVIDLDEVRDEIEEELEEEENWLVGRFAKNISNFALDIVEEIDITMDFRNNGEVKIIVEVMGEREVEYSEWYINDEGELIIEDDDDDRWGRRNKRSRVDIDDADVWMMEGGKLQAYEKGWRGKLEKKKKFI